MREIESSIKNKLCLESHLIKKDRTHLFFNTNTLSLFKLNPLIYKVFYKILEGHKTEDVLKQYKVKNFGEICEMLFKTNSSNIPQKNSSKPVLERLVLNVINHCNLNCRYCYAGGGNYGQENSFMDKKSAIKAIDYFYNIYEIFCIQFFGGEPLLNTAVIENTCKYIHNKYDNNELLRLPTFNIVTNGTIMSSKILEMLTNYEFKVTVSIDGPQFINDHLRGEGTFKKIIKNVDLLKKKNISINIECTFTNHHLLNGFAVPDLMEFFYKQFGLHIAHIPFVGVSDNNELYINEKDLIRSYSKGIKFALDSLNKKDYKLDSFTLRLLQALVNKKKVDVYCPAGITTLAVSSAGDIYPCFMFTGNKNFSIGNIFDKGISSNRLNKVSMLLKESSKWTNLKCTHCWAQSLCFGCLGNDYIVSGSIKNKPECNFIKAFIESFLLEFSEIMDDL